ncbi:hypothetical protein HPB49_000541 [Dermacentor silvarum]|uniref:Uncharacterized protein n=1 Tax=Dermacentor silvarum TaxID=543639 RepID=A0ACB8DL77_DERSI|nr:hypothetical protein HPB49_000541 [Dermacentor silvarum]
MLKVIHQFPGSMEDLLLALKHRYLPKQSMECPPPYSGQPNAGVDEDIQLCEVTTTIQNFRKHTAPGADKISNKILANLDDLSILELTQHLNNTSRPGTIPQE